MANGLVRGGRERRLAVTIRTEAAAPKNALVKGIAVN